jgi:hypothetical protein
MTAKPQTGESPRRPSLGTAILYWLGLLLPMATFPFWPRGWLVNCAGNLFMMGIGLLFVWRNYRDRVDLFSLRGWPYALLVFAGVIALNFSVFSARLMPPGKINPMAAIGRLSILGFVRLFVRVQWFHALFYWLCDGFDSRHAHHTSRSLSLCVDTHVDR